MPHPLIARQVEAAHLESPLGWDFAGDERVRAAFEAGCALVRPGTRIWENIEPALEDLAYEHKQGVADGDDYAQCLLPILGAAPSPEDYARWMFSLKATEPLPGDRVGEWCHLGAGTLNGTTFDVFSPMNLCETLALVVSEHGEHGIWVEYFCPV